ncbi:MAG: hypothetical protein KA715_05905 [Xanthomonadaceae bacterium]|nr:hypothetical protein [Xanthomonadaceae bacterium]
MKRFWLILVLIVGLFEINAFICTAYAQTQSSAPRSEEIPMDDIEDDDVEVVEETEVEEAPAAPAKSKSKKSSVAKVKSALGKDVDGTRALDRGEFEAQTLSTSHYKRNGVSLEVDPD